MREVKDRSFGLWGVAVGIVLSGVVVLSLGPDLNLGSGLADRSDHVIAYTVVTALLLRGMDRYGRRRGGWLSITLLSLGLGAFAAAMELGQAAVHRDADVLDWLAGTVGIAGAVAVHSLLHLLRKITHQHGDAVSTPKSRLSSVWTDAQLPD